MLTEIAIPDNAQPWLTDTLATTLTPPPYNGPPNATGKKQVRPAGRQSQFRLCSQLRTFGQMITRNPVSQPVTVAELVPVRAIIAG